MNRLLLSCVIVAIAAGAAFADDTTPPAAGTPVMAGVGSPPPTPLPQPVKAELNDGSKVEFGADGAVMVVNADGSKTVAPDGVLSLKDGTPFVVRNGKRVSE